MSYCRLALKGVSGGRGVECGGTDTAAWGGVCGVSGWGGISTSADVNTGNCAFLGWVGGVEGDGIVEL